MITAETTEQLELLDTRERASWLRVAEALTGDPDATPWSVAQAARDAGYAGWLGRDEILLCWPLRVLRRQDMRAVTPDHPSAGAVRRRTR